MPYITPDARQYITNMECPPKNAGEINYLITTILNDYWLRNKNYQGINDIVGALEGAKLEFYRRIAVPYEENKIEENGDVYTT